MPIMTEEPHNRAIIVNSCYPVLEVQEYNGSLLLVGRRVISYCSTTQTLYLVGLDVSARSHATTPSTCT